MEEAEVYESARYHMLAVLAGDRPGALQDVDEDHRSDAEAVFANLPPKVEEGEVMEITGSGNQYVVAFNYTGGETDIVIETVWELRNEQPRIIAMRLA